MSNKFWLVISLFAMASCSGDFDFRQPEAANIQIATDRLEFGPAAGQESVTVKTAQLWTVELPSQNDWVSCTTDGATLNVSVRENPDVASRAASVVLRAADKSVKLFVSQTGKQALVSVSSDTLAVEYTSYSTDVVVDANVSWTAYAPASWITTDIKGNKLTIGCGENTGDSRRSSYVLIQNQGVSLKRIFVSQASSVPPVPEYYKIDLNDVDWDESKIFYATNANSDTIAVLTKEYLGYQDDRVVECLYPYRNSKPVFDTRTLSISDKLWIKKDGSAFFVINPASRFDVVEDAGLESLCLVSDVKPHGTVKVGSQIWLMEDYKTTKMADGTDIPVSYAGDPFSNTSKACAIHDSVSPEHYLYTGYCVDGFAPEGWSVPTQEDYQILLNYVITYASLTGNSQFGATSNYKCTISGGNAKFTALNYTNTWTCTKSGAKNYMVGMKPDNGSVNSAQALTGCFSIRLIKK